LVDVQNVIASDFAPMPITALGKSDDRDQLVGTQPFNIENRKRLPKQLMRLHFCFWGAARKLVYREEAPRDCRGSGFKLRFVYFLTCLVTGATSFPAFLRLAIAKHRCNKRPVFSESWCWTWAMIARDGVPESTRGQ